MIASIASRTPVSTLLAVSSFTTQHAMQGAGRPSLQNRTSDPPKNTNRQKPNLYPHRNAFRQSSHGLIPGGS